MSAQQKMQSSGHYALALYAGLEGVARLAQADRAVLLIRPGPEERTYPLLTYGGRSAPPVEAMEPASLFDNWALSWSAAEAQDWTPLPLQALGKEVGAVYLRGEIRLDALPLQTRQFIQLLAHELALVLALLREQNHSLQMAKERQTVLEMLSAVGQIDRRLSDVEEADEILAELQAACQFLLDAEYCLLWEVDWQTETMRPIAGLPPQSAPAAALQMGLHDSHAGWVARTGHSTLSRNMEATPDYNDTFDRLTGVQTRQMLCVPLMLEGRVAWVIQARNKQEGNFDEVDLRLVEALVRNTVRALENAQRHTSRQQEAAQNVEMYSVASHGLRSPLMSILTTIEWILQTGNLNEESRARLEDVRRQTVNLTRFATKILDLARIDTESYTARPAPVAVLPFLRRIVSGFEARSPDHRFRIEASRPLPPVHADETQLSIILDHLLENAIKYSPPNSEVTVRAEAMDGRVTISVCDEGPGIPPEEADKLFSRFYRGAGKNHARHSLGLGLYIVKKLVQAQNGQIWVKNRPNAGSCFQFTLPQEEMVFQNG
ncbi:MAG: GAF domain-containing protein, partial [Caldilineae bacterium]